MLALPTPFRIQEDKIHIMDDAEKEVGEMLSENLGNKFRATKQYRDIIGLIFSAAASFPEQSRAGTIVERPVELDLGES